MNEDVTAFTGTLTGDFYLPPSNEDVGNNNEIIQELIDVGRLMQMALIQEQEQFAPWVTKQMNQIKQRTYILIFFDSIRWCIFIVFALSMKKTHQKVSSHITISMDSPENPYWVMIAY